MKFCLRWIHVMKVHIVCRLAMWTWLSLQLFGGPKRRTYTNMPLVVHGHTMLASRPSRSFLLIYMEVIHLRNEWTKKLIWEEQRLAMAFHHFTTWDAFVSWLMLSHPPSFEICDRFSRSLLWQNDTNSPLG